MPNEHVGACAWLATRLGGDATLSSLVSGPFLDLVPQTDPQTKAPPTFPALIYSLHVPRDRRGVGGRRILSELTYAVKVCGQGNGLLALQSAADRADALLQDAGVQSVSIGGQSYTIAGCYRESPLGYAELSEGVRWVYLGGLYRIVIHPA